MRTQIQRWVRVIGVLAAVLALSEPISGQAQAPCPRGAGAGCAYGCGPGRGAGRGWGPRAQQRFSPSALSTLQGEVTDVQRVARGWHSGVHLTVATTSGTTTVFLGPDFFVDEQSVTIGKGDQVEVTGWSVPSGAATLFVAQAVKRGSDVLTLRSTAGVPLWAGRGARWSS